MHLFSVITKRTTALIILRVSGTLAGGSIAGVELWQAALLAAFIGVMDVAESLSRAYVVDGHLSADEINMAFASSAEAELSKNKTTEATGVDYVVTVDSRLEEEDELEEVDLEDEQAPRNKY